MNDFFELQKHKFTLPLDNPVLAFSLILLIILLAPILLRKLKLPGIIGLIISGVIIGPYGLNILEKNSAVDLFATIGLLYIMFIAGLELDINEFIKNRNKSFIFGLFTFVVPFAIGFPVTHYILGYDINASLLTASLFSTQTLVTYPIVSRSGISQNQAVAVTVGGTILTDTAVLLLLAIVTGKSRGNLDLQFWTKFVISLAVFSGVMFLAVPKISRWFFTKLENEKHAHYIFVLLVVFFSAFLAEISGLEPVIGAFIAGLALNQLIPHSSVLMNRIEFIGNSLFIPFFLISVGMLIDVNVLFSGPMVIFVTLALSIGAISGKWLAALFTQLTLKYSKAQRQLIFGLSTAHAAAILAVVLVGYNAGILDENILNATILFILISCLVASITTEKASREILLTEKEAELSVTENISQRNERILIPVANLSNIEKLLEFTLLIRDKKSDIPVTVLSVVPNNAEAETNIISAKKKLEAFKNDGAAAELKVNTIATIDYNPSSGIARIAKETLSNIIVLGWPGKAGIFDKLVGEKIHSIINNVNKTLFICHLRNLLINQKRIIIVTPPLAEKENDFETWSGKILKLSSELYIPIIHFGNIKTQQAIIENFQHNQSIKTIEFKEFDDHDDIKILSDFVNPNDLLVIISARKNSVSYFSYLDNIPNRLEKYFDKNNKIIVYPQHAELSIRINDDLLSGPEI